MHTDARAPARTRDFMHDDCITGSLSGNRSTKRKRVRGIESSCLIQTGGSGRSSCFLSDCRPFNGAEIKIIGCLFFFLEKYQVSEWPLWKSHQWVLNEKMTPILKTSVPFPPTFLLSRGYESAHANERC